MFRNIFYINLDIDVERRLNCEKQLKESGLVAERFPAICPEDKGNYFSIGARGCQLSHLALIEEAKKRNLDHILILEDDFLLREDFFELCMNLSPIEYDLFYFYRWQISDEFPVRIVPIEGTLCTHAYAINQKYYDTYINVLKNNHEGLPLDMLDFPSEKKFATTVNMIGQMANISRVDGLEKNTRFSSYDD